VESVDDILVEYGTSRAALLGANTTGRTAKAGKTVAAGALEAAEGGDEDDFVIQAPSGLSPGEAGVLEALSYEGTHVNEVVRRVGITTSECIAHLTMLEIRGLISSASGGYYVRL
jgi:predicted Rossmann fold nucleotide-binding protein DprA/Smf involved in DNA uptake